MNTESEHLSFEDQGLKSQTDLLKTSSFTGLFTTQPVPSALLALNAQFPAELSFPVSTPFDIKNGGIVAETSYSLPLTSLTDRALINQNTDEVVVGQLQYGDSLTNFGGKAIASPKDIVFIDQGVDNYQQIIAGINSSIDIFVLNSQQNGIQQISDVLKQRQNISAIHIVSHGNQAELHLGSTNLTTHNLEQYAEQIRGWNSALTNTADILLYGCNVAASDVGKEFIQEIGQLSNADVAASEDLTGLSTLGGDWTLEYASGSIETSALEGAYQGVLFSMTMQDLYSAWQANTLSDLSSITLTLDGSSVLNGSLTIAANDVNSLRLTGTGLNSFVGTGLSTVDTSDDRGLSLTNLNLDLLLSLDSTYNYTVSGQVALNNVPGLTLSASDVTASGTQAGTTVTLTDFQFGVGGNARLGGETLSYTTQNNQISFNGSNLFAFIGYGAETEDTSDDVGLEVSNAGLGLQLNPDNSYSYSISNGSIAVRGIDGLVVEANDVNITGDQDNVTVATGAFALEIGDVVWASGDALSFSSQQTQSGKTVSFGFNNGSFLAGYGIDTEDSSDDVGIAITNADVTLDLNADGSYDYSVSNASAELRGVDGLTLAAGAVSAVGDQTNIALNISNAKVGVKDVIDLSANSLAIAVEDTGTGKNITVSGTGLSAFVGHGIETTAPDDDFGLAISNATLDLQLNADKTYSYALSNAAVDVRGIPGLTLTAGTVGVSGDHTGNNLNVSLNNAVLGINNVMRLSGTSVEFITEGTGAERTVNFNGTGLSAFAGYGAATADINDDTGLAISNADFNLRLNADGTYSYGLANAAVEVHGIPGLVLSVGALSASGDSTSTTIGLSNAVLGIGNVLKLSGEFIEFQLETTGSGHTISFEGQGLSAFAGYGAATLDTSDDIGLAISNADFSVLLNADKTYSYTLDNADLEVRGVAGLTAVAEDVHIEGDQTSNINLSTGSFALAVGNMVGISGDAIAISIQDGQPITISATNAAALVGYGAATVGASDDLGLSITNADIQVTLNDDKTYTYSVTNANAGLVGIDGLTLSVEQVNVAGDQSTVDVTTGAFELGLDGVGYVKGDALALDPADSAIDPLRIAATGISAFVGAGGGTADEAGIKLNTGNLGLVLYDGATPSYALVADGQGELVGVDALSLDGSLAVRINRTGQTVDESIDLGNGSTFDVTFGQGQENQLRVEGDIHANVANALAFGGEFSLELFNNSILGNLNQTSNLSNTSFTLAEQQIPIGEAFYQQLLTTLAAEKTRLEGEHATVDSIQATVDGLSFNENYVDVVGDRINLQTSHDFTNGQKVIYRAGASNTPIGGLEDGRNYYVISANGQSLQLATTLNGTAIDLTSASSGIHHLSQVVDFTATNKIHVDVQQELILFDVAHGLTNGSRVRYDAAQNPPIGGLQDGQDYLVDVIGSTAVKLKDITTGTVVDLTADSQGDHLFRPVLLSPSSASGNGGVDINADTIVFSSPHNLQTGDEIQYYRPYRGQVVGGTLDTLLTRQDVFPYTVQVISSTEIKLLKDGNVLDLTNVGKGLHVMTLIEEAGGDRSHLTFQSPSSTLQFVNSTTVKLNYAHGLTTGQTVTLQLDPSAAYPKSPIAGVNAVAYSTQPKVYNAAHDNIYYVKVAANGNLQFAATAQDLATNTFVSIQAPSGKAGSRFRLMPTWSFDAMSLPGMTEQLGDPVAFTASNSIQVDLESNTLILPTTVDLKVGEAVEYRSGGANPIGGLQDGSTYYVVSNLNGAVKLAETSGGSAIDLTTAGGDGNHSFIRAGVDFRTDNNIAQQRRDTAIALQERLSRDLGIQVTLTAGTATEINDAAGRGVNFHDINVTYDEQQLEKTKLLAGITNGYAFMGNGFGTANEAGVKIDNVDLGLALFKTIDYALPANQQAEMGYALSGKGAAAIVGIPDVTLAGTLDVQLNRSGQAIDETITTPGGEISILFAQPDDITRISGTANVKISDVASLSGAFAIEQTNNQLQISGTNIAAFVGVGLNTAVTTDDVGLSLSNGGFNFTLNQDDTYSYTANGTVATVGMDFLQLSGTAIATGDSTGNLSVALNNVNFTLSDYAQLSGDFNFSVATQNGTQTITLGATNATAFVGIGAATTTTSDDVGLSLSNATLDFTLNPDKTYTYDVNGNVAVVGIDLFDLSGNAHVFGNNNTVTAQLNDLDLKVSDYVRLSGDFAFAIASENNTQIIDLSTTGAAALFGTGVSTPETTDDIGLSLNGVTGNLQIRKPRNSEQFIAYSIAGDINLVGIDQLTLSGQVSAQMNQAPFDVSLGGTIVEAGVNQVAGQGVKLGIAALPGLSSDISGDVVFQIRESDGAILAAVQNVAAQINLSNATIGGSVDGTSSGQTGALTGKLENGSLGFVMLADGQYALKGSGSASLMLGPAIVGGDIGISIVNVNEATTNQANPFSINEAIAVGNQSVAVNFTNITADLFEFTTDNLYVDLILTDEIKNALRSASGVLDGIKQSLAPQYDQNGKLISGNESLLSYTIPIADTSLNDILGISDYLALGTSINEYLSLDNPADPNDQTLLGLIAYLKEDWLTTLPVYDGLDFVYNKDAKTLTLAYKTNATYDTSLAFNLGAEAKKFGLEISGDATLDLKVNAGIDFALNFGWGNGVTTDFTLNDLSFNAGASVNDLVLGAYFGPLEASIGSYETNKEKGRVSLALGGNLTYTDHDNNPATAKKFDFSVTNGGTLNATLPFYASLAGHDLAADATPKIFLQGSVFTQDAQGKLAPGSFTFTHENFDRLLNFRNFSIVDVVLMFKDVVTWAEQYRDYSIMDTAIPFVDLSLGDALDFASTINNNVLSKIDFYKPRKDLLSGTGAALTTLTSPRVDLLSGTGGSLATVTVGGQQVKRLTDSDTTFNTTYKGKYITLDGVGVFQITAVNGSSLDLTQVKGISGTPNLSSLNYVIHERQTEITRITDSDTTFNATYKGKYTTLDGVGIFQITAVNGSSLDLTQVNDSQTALFKVAENPNLSSLNYVIHEKHEMIRSFQELIVAVNKSGILPLNVPLDYDPIANTFKIPFAFKQDLPVLSDLPLDFGMNLGELSLSSSSKASLKAGVDGRIDVVIDFDGRVLTDANGNPLKDKAGKTLTGVELFVENVKLKGDISFDVTDLEVAAKLGFLGLTAGGSGTGSGIHLGASIEAGLNGRKSFSQLLDGDFNQPLGAKAPDGTPKDAFYLNFIGDAYARLKGLKVNAGVGSFSISPDVELGVYLPNLLKPTGTQVVTQPIGQPFNLKTQIDNLTLKNEGVVVVLPDVSDLLSLKNLSFADIVRGIRAGIDFLNDSLATEAFYTSPIPVIDRSLKDTFTFMDEIAAKIQLVAENPAGALQEVESTIERILGLTDNNSLAPQDQLFSLYLKDNLLNVHLGWQALFSKQFGFALDLATFKDLSGNAGATALDAISSLVDVSSKATVTLEAIAKLNFDIGISLASLKSGSPEIFLHDYNPVTGKGTHAQVGVRLESSNLDLGFKVGPMNLGTKGGTVVLDGDGNIATKDYAGLLVAIDQKAGTRPDDGRFYIGKETFSDNFDIKLVGGFDVQLPIYLDVLGFTTQLDQPIRVQTNPVYGDQGLTQLFKHLVNSPSKGAANPIVMTFPDIRGAFSLLGGNFSVLALLNDPTVIIDGVDTAVGVLEYMMDSNLAQDIPLIGDKLARGAAFLRDIRQGVLADLRQKLSGKGKAIEIIRQTLWDVLGPAQLNLLLDRNGDSQISIDDVQVGWYDINGILLQPWQVGSNLPAKTDAIQFDLTLGGKIFGAGLDLPLDFDLPGFSLEVGGGFGLDMGWSFDFGFGISVSDTFYISTNKDLNNKELELNISAFLDGNTSTLSTPQNAEVFTAKGQLLFFDADLRDNRPNGKASGVYGGLSLDVIGDARGRLTFNRLLSGKLSDLFKVNFGVNANLSLEATLAIVGAQGLPQLRGDIEVNWDWQVGKPVVSPGVNIKNLEVDLGSYVGDFLKPIADTLHNTLEPLMPLVRVLNQKVPGLSIVTSDDTIKGLINLLLQLKGYRTIDWSFIDEAEQIYALSGVLATLNPGDWMPLGDIKGLGTATPTSTPTTQALPAGLQQLETSLTQNTRQTSKPSGSSNTPRSGFQVLPYLKDISNWMKVLSGGDATLFTYELPLLEFRAELEVLLFSYGIPGIASIDINAIARLYAMADLGFGYDTYGIRKAIDTGNPLYALDGLYIMDWNMKGEEKPEFRFKGSIGLGGELDVFIASIGAEGLISLNMDVDLQDIEKSTLTKDVDGYVTGQTWMGDGKIRGSELFTMVTYEPSASNLNGLGNLFNIDGSINFELNLVGQAFGASFSENLLDVELYKFNYDAPKVQPKLAEVQNGLLYLNSGNRSADRKYGDLTDGGETFYLYTDKASGQVGVEYDGYYQTFAGVTKVIAHGGSGDDTFDASHLDGVVVEFYGGDGNDTLITGNAGGFLDGGDGNDTLDAAASTSTRNNWIVGGKGDDVLKGGHGVDKLFGGEGDDKLDGGAGDDYLDGSSGADTIDGGEGNDFSVLDKDFGRDRWNDDDGESIYDFSQINEDLEVYISQLSITVRRQGTDNELKVTGTSSVAALANLKLGSGNDKIAITRRSISQFLQIDFGDGDDQLIVEDVGTTTGSLNASFINGLGMGGTIQYSNLEDLKIQLGSTSDIFTMVTTHSGLTTLNTGAGIDAVTVQTTAGETYINTEDDADTVTIQNTGLHTRTYVDAGKGNDWVNVETIDGETKINLGEDDDTINVSDPTSRAEGIRDRLTIIGGLGSDLLNVSDTKETIDTTGYLTDSQMTGLGMSGLIDYGTMDMVSVNLGSGSDTFTIFDTHTGQTQINLGKGGDTVFIEAISGGTTVKGGENNDIMNVGSANNLLDRISAQLTVQGGTGDDILNAIDSGDITNNTGTLTSSRIAGLGMTGQIDYGSFELLDLQLGSGSDQLTVLSTHTNRTQIDLADGEDRASVETVSGETTLKAGDGDDMVNISTTTGLLDAINAALVVKGGTGHDLLEVNDSGDSNNNTGRLSDSRISGLDMAGWIDYGTFEALDMKLGSGHDALTIANTHSETSMISSSAGSDVIRIEAIAGETILKTNEGDDAITIGNTAGLLDFIQAHLAVNGGEGTDLLNLDDSGDRNNNTGTLFDNQVAGLGISQPVEYADIESVAIALGSGNDTFTIQANNADAAFLDTGSGNDWVNVETIRGETTIKGSDGDDIVVVHNSNHRLEDITAPLVVNGGTGSDILQLDDSGETVNSNGFVANGLVAGLGMVYAVEYDSVEVLDVQLGSGHDHFRISSTQTTEVQLDMAAGNDAVTIEAIQAETTVKAGAGDDLIEIGGVDQQLEAINGYLSIKGEQGNDSVTLNDAGSTANTTGMLTERSVIGLGMETQVDYNDIESLTVTLGSGQDTFTVANTHQGYTQVNTSAGNDVVNVWAIAGETTVKTGTGDDTVQVGNQSQSLNGIQSDLVIRGSVGNDRLHLVNTGATANQTGAMTDSMIAGLGMSGTIQHGTVELVDIQLGAGNDTFQMLGSHTGQTQIDTGAGNDAVSVATVVGATTLKMGTGDDSVVVSNSSQTVNGIANELTIKGDAGYDSLAVDDSGDTIDNVGSLSDRAILGLGMVNPIEYGSIESIDIKLGSGSDTFTVTGTVSGQTTLTTSAGHDVVKVEAIAGDTTIKTNDGDDTIVISSSARTLDTIQASVLIAGGAGYDVVDVNDSGDSANNSALITSNSISGLGMGGTVTYDAIEFLNLGLGSGNNSLVVQTTHVNATRIDTAAGDDTVVINSIAGETSLKTGSGNDAVYVGTSQNGVDGIDQPLTVSGGGGADRLDIDDSVNTTNSVVFLSDTQVGGLEMNSSIDYGSFETVNLHLGSGNDAVDIKATQTGETNIDTAAGNDEVTVSNVYGETNLDGAIGQDPLNLGLISSLLKTVNFELIRNFFGM